MSSQLTKTDNTFFLDKVYLRINNLPAKDELLVLDAYAGNSKIWNYIKSKINKTINIISIDKCKYDKIDLIGDNIKYLKSLDLSIFDVIDLDAYGIPYQQLKHILDFYKNNPFECVVFITFIQSLYGQLNKGMLLDLGYSETMIKKAPTLFNRYGFEKFKLWLGLQSVKEIIYRNVDNKYYIAINLQLRR